MAIFRKATVNKRLDNLESFYQELRKALEGRKPDTLGSKAYGFEKDEFVQDCVSVDLNDVLVKLEHFKAEFLAIKQLKDYAISPKRDY